MRNAQNSTEYNNIQVVEENGDIYFQSLLWCVVCRIRCRNCTPEARCYDWQCNDPDPEKKNMKKLKISVQRFLGAEFVVLFSLALKSLLKSLIKMINISLK